MNKITNFFCYVGLSVLLSFIVSFIISRLYGTGFMEGLFWIGIVIIAAGGLLSISGNASGTQIYGGGADSQYQAFANIESLNLERKSTEFYKNFKKQMVFNPRISGLGVLFSGVILIVVGLIVQ